MVVLVLAAGALAVTAGPGDAAWRARVLRPQPVEGRDLGGGWKLWVHVHSAPRRADAALAACTDGDQQLFRRFSRAGTAGLRFRYSSFLAPRGVRAEAVETIRDALETWDAVVPSDYFRLDADGGSPFPRRDGTSSIGWTFMFPRSTLATAYTWEGPDGRIAEADVLFNILQPWGVYSTCNGGSTIELGNVATHEIGHTVGLDHVSDPGAFATLYPSAPAGEVRKRTLTTGDENGFGESLR